MDDLRQGAQGLIDFPGAFKDCGYVRIKRDDVHPPPITRGVQIRSGVAKVVLGENVIHASPNSIARFTKVFLHSFCVRGESPAGR